MERGGEGPVRAQLAQLAVASEAEGRSERNRNGVTWLGFAGGASHTRAARERGGQDEDDDRGGRLGRESEQKMQLRVCVCCTDMRPYRDTYDAP